MSETIKAKKIFSKPRRADAIPSPSGTIRPGPNTNAAYHSFVDHSVEETSEYSFTLVTRRIALIPASSRGKVFTTSRFQLTNTISIGLTFNF